MAQPFEFDLVVRSGSSLVTPVGRGRVSVRAFTDLKLHDLNDAEQAGIIEFLKSMIVAE